jgi:hypothetical protein
LKTKELRFLVVQKSSEEYERKGDRLETCSIVRMAKRERGFWLEGCAPLFLVSVAAKRLSPAVSLLFATLAGKFISVAAKGVTLRSSGRVGAGCSQESNWGGREDFERVRRTA